MKGTSSEILVMVFLFITASTMFAQIMMIEDGITSQASLAVDELRMVSRADSVSGSYTYDFAKLGAEYSINQKAYELAGDGGKLSFTGSNIDQKSENDLKSEALNSLETESEEYFQKTYVKGVNPTGCDLDTGKFDFDLSKSQEHIVGTMNPVESILIKCDSEQTTVTSRRGSNVEIKLNSSFNRYGAMARETVSMLDDLNKKWSGTEKDYSATAKVCGSPVGLGQKAKTNAEIKAENSFESDADEVMSPDLSDTSIIDESYSVDTTETSSSGPTDIGSCSCSCVEKSVCTEESDDSDDDKTDEEALKQANPDSDSEGLSWNPRKSSQTVFASFVSSPTFVAVDACGQNGCSSNEIQVCDKTEYEAKSTVEVDKADAEFKLVDDKYKILTKTGYKTLKFNVDKYSQVIKGDVN